MKTNSFPAPQILAAVVALMAFSAAACLSQDVPNGVHYKKISMQSNAQAKSALEQALRSTETPTGFLSGVITCGPILWNDLKTSQQTLAKDSTPVTMMLSVPESIRAEGRVFKTEEQRKAFWKLALEKYPALRKGVVRPASTKEIQFYWSTIPFDIEEPFFAIETPADVFIANLKLENGSTTLFWLDRIDDLKKLKK
jgi:hypothetical protein